MPFNLVSLKVIQTRGLSAGGIRDAKVSFQCFASLARSAVAYKSFHGFFINHRLCACVMLKCNKTSIIFRYHVKWLLDNYYYDRND